MSSITKSPSSVAAALPPPVPLQQARNEHWRGDLPPPPSNLMFCPPNQGKYSNSLNIINRHGNLLSLLDAVYPPTICHVCDTELASPSEADQHYQLKHFHHLNYNNKNIKSKQRYLCLSPHCDQTFRSRGLLRFHISTCHLVDNEQVARTDPLYLLYAPPSSSDLGMQISASLSPNNSTTSTPTTMMVPQKRKYERRQKTWNPVGKSSLPGQTNFTLSSSSPSASLNMEQPQPKRRGRPPKIKSVMPLSNMINNNNNNTEHVKSNRVASSMITFSSDDSGKRNESIQDTKSLHQPKVFKLVQQVIPQRGASSVASPSSTFSSTLRPKNISRSNLSQTSQRLLAEKYNPLECPACQMTFPRKKNVATHLATAHAGEECFQCIYADCYHPKRFSTREGLVYHLLHSHDTGTEFNTKNAGSDTSNSEQALIDSSDTASMDDDSTQTTTMIQPLKKLDDDNGVEQDEIGNNNSRQIRTNGIKKTRSTTPSQRGRKKRS